MAGNMRIPVDAVIRPEKLTEYLLKARPWDDKSKFLNQAGFTLEDPQALEVAIRRVVAAADAVEDGTNEYGTFFRVEGILEGPAQQSLAVVLIWLQWKLDDTFHFVTLKPVRR
jgi:hypothetical protein